MAYESPTDAVLAGVAVQDALAKHNEGKREPDRLDVRIAINTGEVNLADNDIFGGPVNITARIEGVAEAGEVFFTEAVYLAMNKKEVPSSEVGLLQLKGIPENIRVYKVKREHPVDGITRTAMGQADRGATEERRRPAPFVNEPAPKARLVEPGRRPSLWRRAAALGIDAVICLIIVGFLKGRDGDRVDVRLRTDGNKPAARSRLRVGDDGIHGNIGGSKVSIDENGVSIGPGGTEAVENASAEGSWKVVHRTVRRNYFFALVWFVYTLVFLKRMGATPGKRILKLAVVGQDGSPLDGKQRFYRAGFSIVSGYALFLGYLWAVWEKDRRTWHDLIAGTRVIQTE